MEGPQQLRIGFVGLGAMGAGIARRLLAAGHPVTGWNRTRAKAEELASEGLAVAETPREIAPGSVFVEMSTIAPERSRALAGEIEAAGGTMLDAPVSGSIATLEQGRLSIMVGGDPAAFERVRPLLLDVGPKVTHVGENGQALVMKVSINLALIVQVISFCEAVALAEKQGIDREVAVDAMLKSVVASPVLGYRGPFILDGRMPEVAWADVDLQQKDAILALDLARANGVPAPLIAAANEILNACRGLGIGDNDFVVAYEVYRRLAGLA